MCFRVGATDAEFLAQEFAPHLAPADLVNLENYHAFVKLTVDGAPVTPFSMTTLQPNCAALHQGHREKIIRVSRERYGWLREEVEQRIGRWLEQANQDLPTEAAAGLRAA